MYSAVTQKLEHEFDGISLRELNASSMMLTRKCNKYIVNGSVLTDFLAEIQDSFRVLDIEGTRQFVYETQYFDTPDFQTYFDHHSKRRKRIKVRIRRYIDADLCFLEIKLKTKRGITKKLRVPYDKEKYKVIDRFGKQFLDDSITEVYQQASDIQFVPSIEVNYERITLVAKEGKERLTIDRNIYFRDGEEEYRVDEDYFIVETKSAKGNGRSDKIMRRLHHHPSKFCSKYCIGLIGLNKVQKRNNFLPVLRKLQMESLP